MRNGSIETQTADQVAMTIPAARDVLRRYHIDPSSRLSLYHSAAMVSVAPEELLAVLGYKARQTIGQRARHPVDRESGVEV